MQALPTGWHHEYIYIYHDIHMNMYLDIFLKTSFVHFTCYDKDNLHVIKLAFFLSISNMLKSIHILTYKIDVF